jgi:uncharacterized protein YceH (UPF0502 family)
MSRLERELEQALRREADQAELIAQLTSRVEQLELEIAALRSRLGEGNR